MPDGSATELVEPESPFHSADGAREMFPEAPPEAVLSRERKLPLSGQSFSSTIDSFHPSLLVEEPEQDLLFRRGTGVRKLRMNNSTWNKFRPYWEQENPDAVPLFDKESAKAAAGSKDESGNSKRATRSVIGLPIISPYNNVIHMFITFMMWFDLTYTAVLVPMTVGFGFGAFKTTYGALSNILITLDVVAGALFITTLYLGFHVGFIAQYNLKQHVMMNGKAVAKYYIEHGTFMVDFISSFVYLLQIISLIVADATDSDNNILLWTLQALQVLRMVRLCVLVRVVKGLVLRCSTWRSSSKVFSGGMLYTLLIIYLLFFVVNFTSSIWFFVGSWYANKNNVNWISLALDGGIDDCFVVEFTWQQPRYLAGQSVPPAECAAEGSIPFVQFHWAYMLSIYWSVTTMTTVGYGDITPTNSGEMVVALTVMFLGVMTFAILIGSMQDIFANANEASERATALRNKMSQVDAWMHERKLSKVTRAKIRRFFNEAWLESAVEAQRQMVFYDLPSQLQGAVATDIMLEMLFNTRILKELEPECLGWLVSRLKPLSAGIGVDIASQGDRADRLWIIESGTIAATFGGKVERVESAPALISKATVLQKLDTHFETRRCGFRAMTPCSLWELSLQDLFNFGVLFPEEHDKLMHLVAVEVLTYSGLMSTTGSIDAQDVMGVLQAFAEPSTGAASSPGAAAGKAASELERDAAEGTECPGPGPGQVEVEGVGAVDGKSLLNLVIAMKDNEGTSAEDLEDLKKLALTVSGSAQQGPAALPQGADTSMMSQDDEQLPGGAVVRQLCSDVQELLSRVRLIDARLADMERSMPRGTQGLNFRE